MNKAFSAILPVLCCTLLAWPGPARGDLAADVLAMTGARTKIVWAHQVTPGKRHWGGGAAAFELVGFDTADGKERVILPGPASYGNPSVMPDGERVIFTNGSRQICIVDWPAPGGKGPGKGKARVLTAGFALCGWVDPKTGVQWIYAGQGEFHAPIFRFRVDKPDVREVVWKSACSCTSGAQVSADGTRLGSMFPHPRAGVAILPNGGSKGYGGGCEGSLASDNSYRFMHMGEWAGHSGVVMYDAGGANKRTVAFTNFPGRGRQDSWNPRWASDSQFLTVSSPNAGARQEVYLGEFNAKFTGVKRWIQISTRAGQDLCSHAWIDPGLGRYYGEAPLTVAIPAELTPGQWEWDYGDGTKERSDSGKHTYKKDGAYPIVARKGKKVLKGWANVQDRSGPTAVSARLLDEKRILVTFSERVQLKDARITLASRRQVKAFRLGGDGVELTVELAEALGSQDVLIFQGVFDRSGSPNPMSKPRVPVVPLPWPASRKDMVLLWETSRTPNICLDPEAKSFVPIELARHGVASFDRLGAMRFGGGAYAAAGAGAGIVRLCKRTSAFSLQATITPSAASQGDQTTPARILGCGRRGRDWRQVNFALHQEGAMLVLYLRNKLPGMKDLYFGEVGRAPLCTLAAGKANHVTVSYAAGELVCYLNGKRVHRTADVKGTLSWGATDRKAGVHFGAAYSRGAFLLPWRGWLEGVVFYSRAIRAEEAAKDYAQYAKKLAARKPVPQIRLQVKLAARSEVPDPVSIAPYRSAMVVCEYDVLRVIQGTYPHKKVRVARWALVDRRKTAFASAAIGAAETLLLEKYSDHAELQGQLLRDTLEEDFDLTLFVRPEGMMAVAAPKRSGPSAKERLGLAKSYLSAGLKDKALAILREILRRDRRSKQAAEARRLLKQHDRGE